MPTTPTPKNLEDFQREAVPDRGVRDDFWFDLEGWRDASGDVITGSTTPERITLDTDLFAIKWDHGDTATNTIRRQGRVPGRYGQQVRDLKVICTVRKKDSADENTDLKMQATLSYTDATTGERVTLTTAATTTIPSTAVGTAMSNFIDVEIDLGARLRAEGKTMKCGQAFVVIVGPNETVGSSDMDLELRDIAIRSAMHLTMFDENDRGPGGNA